MVKTFLLISPLINNAKKAKLPAVKVMDQAVINSFRLISGCVFQINYIKLYRSNGSCNFAASKMHRL